jgi:hypothetical protein
MKIVDPYGTQGEVKIKLYAIRDKKNGNAQPKELRKLAEANRGLTRRDMYDLLREYGASMDTANELSADQPVKQPGSTPWNW